MYVKHKMHYLKKGNLDKGLSFRKPLIVKKGIFFFYHKEFMALNFFSSMKEKKIPLDFMSAFDIF